MKSFEDVWDDLPVCGWLEKDEARLLWEYAGQFEGPILEVGCYYGRSSVLLASLGRPVYCVDPFIGFDQDEPTGTKIMAGWKQNVWDRRGLHNAVLYTTKVEHLHINTKVGFAYLDGDHTHEGTTAQIEKALSMRFPTRPLGIAVHDVNTECGQGDPRSLDVHKACVAALGPPLKLVNRLGVWKVA